MKDEVIGITRNRTDFWFTCVDSEVIGNKELSLMARYIFSVLCMIAGFGHRSCSPSNQEIAQISGFSERTVIRACKELEARGAIIRETRFSEDGKQVSCITHLVGCPSEEEAL
ncbi:MAG: helix-turn-helix domain-containing protein [Synergistaceae bacterium]|nr:helix-turn-helix domain-containing protein [Synergistaceae bacterium]